MKSRNSTYINEQVCLCDVIWQPCAVNNAAEDRTFFFKRTSMYLLYKLGYIGGKPCQEKNLVGLGFFDELYVWGVVLMVKFQYWIMAVT